MRYWWVNQGQTYKHEVPGGYLWSPKEKANGQRNVYWDNMLEVQPGDVIFSFANGAIRAVGVAAGNAYSDTKPKIFGRSGDAWSDDGWKLDVIFKPLTQSLDPRPFMAEIAPLLPEKYSPIHVSGAGLQVYLAAISGELGQLLLALTSAVLPTLETGRLEDLKFDELEQEIALDDSMPETMRVTLIKARRGQGVFRDRVQTIESACRVTGVSADSLLIASHIKPWKGSDPQERLDGNNGLFLSPHVDKLFDKGLISFERNGSMLVSPRLELDVLERWSIDPTRKYGRFNNDQAYFLEFHNESIFESTAA